MSSLVYLNGDFVPKLSAKLSVYDHGLLYGDGVWEGMRLRDGEIPHLDEHWHYLAAAAEVISLALPFDASEFHKLIRQTVARNVRRTGYVRIVVTRGPGTIGLDPRKCDPHIVILVDDVVPFPTELFSHGLHVVTAKSIRLDPTNPLHRIRSLSHGHMALAKSEALRAGCLDAILLTPTGEVAGTCEGHLFWVKSGSIFTPPREASVSGDVAADQVRENRQVQSKLLTVANLFEADELFLTGTAPGTIGIVRVNNQDIGGGSEGPITRSIRTATLPPPAVEAIS